MACEQGAGRKVEETASQGDGRSVSLEAVLERKTPPRRRVLRLALMLVVVFGLGGGLLLRQSSLNRPATPPRATHGPYVAALIQRMSAGAR